jgi:hypothetical protein
LADRSAELTIEHGETSMTTVDSHFIAWSPGGGTGYAFSNSGGGPPYAVGAFMFGAEVGVWGLSYDGIAVAAFSHHYTGVSSLSVDGYGVRGESNYSSGVYGVSGYWGPQLAQGPKVGVNIMPPIAGVFGTSDQGPGVIGTSRVRMGLYGLSTANAGVVGETTSPLAAGGHFFGADRTNPQSYAGRFEGNVRVLGDLTVDGQIFAGVKDAIVPFPDGSKRVLHCMESPEHWFEDFGAGKLKRGRAVVKIDADFAKVIKRSDYHVFLTPCGDCRGLYVRRQGGLSFEVRELAGGTSSAAFSYRIVGRRKDIKGHRRFAKIDTRLPLPVPRARPARTARRMKMPPRTPEGLRAFAARMQKEARARMRKRGRKGKPSAG